MVKLIAAWLLFIILAAGGASGAPGSSHNSDKFQGVQASICDPYDGSYNGILRSPNYPGCYPNNVHCSWVISGPPGYRVGLYFFLIRMESCCDYLEIRDGYYEWSPVIARYTGNAAPAPIYSSSNHMRITFHTDGSVTDYGFDTDYFITYGGGGDSSTEWYTSTAGTTGGTERGSPLIEKQKWEKGESRRRLNVTNARAMVFCNSYPTTDWTWSTPPVDITPTTTRTTTDPTTTTTNGTSKPTTTTGAPPGGGAGIVINNNNNMFVNFFGNWSLPGGGGWYDALKEKLGGVSVN